MPANRIWSLFPFIALPAILASILVLATAEYSLAQEPAPPLDWIRQFGSVGNDNAYGIALDGLGNGYVVGTIEESLSGEAHLGGSDVYLRKYSSSGIEMWTRQFGTGSNDWARGVAVDEAGDVYVVGSVQGTLPDTTAVNPRDAFIRKYDSSGNVKWTKQFAAGILDVPHSLAVAADRDGNAYVAGRVEGSRDLFLRKYDSSGVLQWIEEFGSSGHDFAHAVAVDGAGGLYIAGQVGSVFPGETSAGNADAFVRKYNPSVDCMPTCIVEEWTRQFGTGSFDRAFGLVVDSASGDVYVVGSVQDGALPGTTFLGDHDAFVRKYDTTGNEQWTRQFGTANRDQSHGVAVDAAGNVYVAGLAGDALPGQTSDGDWDAFVRKYDGDGNELWTNQFGTSAVEYALGVAVADVDAVYAAGFTHGTLPGQPSEGLQDAFIAKTGLAASGSGRIAFDSDRDGNFDIYVMDEDGTDQTRLTNNPADDRAPAWSPDDTEIAFNSVRDGNSEIYVMKADGTGPKTNLTNNPAHDAGAAWSPDGSKIAFFSDRGGDFQIYVMNADGTGVTNLSNNSFSEFDADWSPDGSRLAFFSNRDGVMWDIFVMNVDGTNPVNLTNNTEVDVSPAWSPDGAKIAFRSERDGNADIHVMNSDGASPINLTNNPNPDDKAPEWSPDGSQIAFHTSRDGNFEIYAMNSDGSGQTNLSNNPADDTNPAWSSGAATAGDSDDPGSIYIASGDSVAAGSDIGGQFEKNKENAYPHYVLDYLRRYNYNSSIPSGCKPPNRGEVNGTEDIYNFAHRGDTTLDYDTHQLPSVADCQPELITLTIGANDFLQPVNQCLTEAEDEVGWMIDLLPSDLQWSGTISAKLGCFKGVADEIDTYIDVLRIGLDLVFQGLTTDTEADVLATGYHNPLPILGIEGVLSGADIGGLLEDLTGLINSDIQIHVNGDTSRFGYVDISEAVKGHEFGSECSYIEPALPVPAHPNERGQQVIASLVIKEARESGFIPSDSPSLPFVACATEDPNSQIVIHGAEFQHGATVKFGGVSVQVLEVSDNGFHIRVRPPVQDTVNGTVDIEVTNPDGSAAMLTDGYPIPDPSLGRRVLTFFGFSPVTLTVYDPLGRRIGFHPATGGSVNEITDALFLEEEGKKGVAVVIPNPIQGQYGYQVHGTGTGTYNLVIFSPLTDAVDNPVVLLDVPISEGEVHSDIVNAKGNIPPVANAGPDQVVATTSPSGAAVTLNGSGSSDPDNDELTYAWTGPFSEGGGTATGISPTVTFTAPGVHTVTLTVDDGNGGVDTDTVEITVLDSSTCPDDALISNYQTNPGDDQFVEVANVGASPISVGGCSVVTFDVYTETSIEEATVGLSGVLFPGETMRANFSGALPAGPGAIGIYNVTPPPPDETPFSTDNEITGMVYLSNEEVFGIGHLTQPTHNEIYECVYGGTNSGGPFSRENFKPLADCLP